MPQPIKTYIRTQGMVTALANMVINPALAWLLNRQAGVVPLSDIVVDTAVTGFVMTLVVTWFAVTGAHRELARGGLTVGDVVPGKGSWLERLPGRVGALALTLGVGAAAIITPLVGGLLLALGFAGLPLGWFMLLKAVYTGPASYMTARWAIVRQVEVGYNTNLVR